MTRTTELMRTNPTSSAAHAVTATLFAPVDRRNRSRLRDLCEEVLASYRAASARDVISEQDRLESRDILGRIAPLSRR